MIRTIYTTPPKVPKSKPKTAAQTGLPEHEWLSGYAAGQCYTGAPETIREFAERAHKKQHYRRHLDAFVSGYVAGYRGDQLKRREVLDALSQKMTASP